ncbi:MAG TPA: hypothetical protein VM054_01120 [bacterium]|nr:hypothetical protein [bacterium]
MRKLLFILCLPVLTLAAGGTDPLGDFSEAYGAREYVFGEAAVAVPGQPSYLPGANPLLADYTAGVSIGATYAMPFAAIPEVNRQSLDLTYPITGLLRLGTLVLDVDRSDAGAIPGYDETGRPTGQDYHDTATAINIGWSIGLGTKVILPEDISFTEEEEEEDTGEVEEYVETYEEPEDWVSQAPEYRPGYYLGLNFRVFAREVAGAGDQGFGMDLGFAVPIVWRWLYAAVTCENFIQPNIQLYDVRSLGQRRVRGALAFTWEGLVVAVGGMADFSDDWRWSAAAEYTIGGVAALRVGYHGEDDLRAGVGFTLGGLGADFAVGFGRPELGQSWRVTIGWML